MLASFVFLSTEQAPASTELEETVRQADTSRQEYVNAFRDLIGIETRVTELLNKNGTTEKRRTVVSDFLVYRSKFQSDMVVDDDLTTPAVLLHKEIDYEPSPLGANLPARIVTSNFDKAGEKGRHTLRPVTRITFTYDGFKRFDVTTATEMKNARLE